MRWTLAVSTDRKVFVAIVDSEGIGQQSVPNVARMVKEAKVRMARSRARKANQAKGKLMMARRTAKAKVTNGKHARHLKGIAIIVGHGHMEKDCFTQAETKGKGKGAGSPDDSEASVPKKHFSWRIWFVLVGNSQDDEWKWNDCPKVTSTLDSGAAVSVAPKSLGDVYPMVIEEPRLQKNGDWRIRTR